MTALKWLCGFTHWQKTKRTVPNVYFTPAESSLIVTPEFDYPLPPFPCAGTASPQDVHSTRTADPIPSNENRSCPPVSSYHYVLARQARDIDVLPAGNPEPGDYSSDIPSTTFRANASTESIARPSARSKLRKSRRRKAPSPVRAYDPDMHWPTSIPSASVSVQNLPASSAIGTAGDRVEAATYTNLSSPTASTIALSATSEGLISRSASSGGAQASRRSSIVAKKLTKRKRPPPLPSADALLSEKERPVQAVPNKLPPTIIPDASSSTHGLRSRPVPSSANRRVVTAASVAADYARFWNISAPDLPSVRPEYMRRASMPTPMPTRSRPRAFSYVPRKPVPGPSPLRDRADWRTYDRFERESVSDFLYGANAPANTTLWQATEGENHDVVSCLFRLWTHARSLSYEYANVISVCQAQMARAVPGRC